MLPLFAEAGTWEWASQLWQDAHGWQAIYADKMRSSLFTGFLTLASFLMAVASFLILNLKTHVLDRESYLQEWLKDNPKGDPKDIYIPLEKLAKRFAKNIVISLSASVVQFTVGMIEHPLAALFCVLVAGFAFGYLFATIAHFISELKIMTVWLRHDGPPKK